MSILFVYDHDNTISLTSEADKKALKLTFSRFLNGHTDEIDFENELRGKDIGDVCDYVNNKFGMTLDKNDVRQNFRASFEQVIDHVKPTLGTVEAIKTLRECGAIQGIATNGSQSRLRTTFKFYAEHPEFKPLADSLQTFAFSALDDLETPRLKPLPDIYIHAVNQIAATASMRHDDTHVICMVEDSMSGLTAAREARRVLANTFTRATILCAGFYGDRYQIAPDQAQAACNMLKNHGADFCVGSMMDLVHHTQPHFVGRRP